MCAGKVNHLVAEHLGLARQGIVCMIGPGSETPPGEQSRLWFQYANGEIKEEPWGVADGD